MHPCLHGGEEGPLWLIADVCLRKGAAKDSQNGEAIRVQTSQKTCELVSPCMRKLILRVGAGYLSHGPTLQGPRGSGTGKKRDGAKLRPQKRNLNVKEEETSKARETPEKSQGALDATLFQLGGRKRTCLHLRV